MEIKVTRHRGLGHTTNYDIKVVHEGATIQTDWLSEKEVGDLAVSFLEDTLLDNCWQSEVVGKLIEAGVITHEQILEYVAESGDE